MTPRPTREWTPFGSSRTRTNLALTSNERSARVEGIFEEEVTDHATNTLVAGDRITGYGLGLDDVERVLQRVDTS